MENPFELALMTIVSQEYVKKHIVHGTSRWVASPGTMEEVVSLVRLASEYGKSVTPIGALRRLGTLFKDGQAELWIETGRLCSIIEYSPEDMVITVGAGMRLCDLQHELLKFNQFLPVDPVGDVDETLGGIVATNAWGPSRALYGTLRDHVIGTRTVLANGDVVRTGGRVVKNVAGYDLTKLLVGSFGSLGVMIEITLRVRPYPTQRTVTLLSGSVADVDRARAELMDATLIPSVFECVNTSLARTLTSSLGTHGALGTHGSLTLAVGCDEPVEGTAFQEGVLRAWSSSYSLEILTFTPEQTAVLWEDYHMTLRTAATVLRVQGKPSTLIEIAGTLLAAVNQEWMWLSGCIPAGVLRLFFAADDDAVALVTACVSHLTACGLSLHYEKLPTDHHDFPSVSQEIAIPDSKQTVHRLIYQAFDPAGLFSSTRLGGA